VSQTTTKTRESSIVWWAPQDCYPYSC